MVLDFSSYIKVFHSADFLNASEQSFLVHARLMANRVINLDILLLHRHHRGT